MVEMKWGGGQIFAFSAIDGQTDYHNGLVLRSALHEFALEIKFPEECGIITLGETCPDKFDFAGDYLNAATCRAAFADAHHLLLEGACKAKLTGSRIRCAAEGKRTLIGVAEFFDPALLHADLDSLIAARRQWVDHFGITDPVVRKACSQLKTQLMSPEGAIRHTWSTPDRYPHRAMWIWDSAFHALALRHLDLKLAKEILLAVFDAQHSDGFVPHMTNPGEHSGVIQPPVLGYAAAKLAAMGDDPGFLAEFYAKNGRFLQWIMTHRDTDGGGLVEWHISGDRHCRCDESGMDNSVRFDNARPLDAPDFNAFLAGDCRAMASFARKLGKADEAAQWQCECDRINALMNKLLWNEKEGFYFDRDVKTGELSCVASSVGFLPLISGAPTREQAARLAEKLHDKTTFATRFPIPSIARNDPDYQPDMWRGPVWTNVNAMIAEAFQQYGFTEESSILFKTMEKMVRRYVEEYGCFFEFYDACDELPPPKLWRKGYNSEEVYHQPLRDYGWTAAIFLDQWKSR